MGGATCHGDGGRGRVVCEGNGGQDKCFMSSVRVVLVSVDKYGLVWYNWLMQQTITIRRHTIYFPLASNSPFTSNEACKSAEHGGMDSRF